MNPLSFSALKLSLCVMFMGWMVNFGIAPVWAEIEVMNEEGFAKKKGLLPIDELNDIFTRETITGDEFNRLEKLAYNSESQYLEKLWPEYIKLKIKSNTPLSSDDFQQTLRTCKEIERNLVLQRQMMIDWVIKRLESKMDTQGKVFEIYARLIAFGSDEELIRLSPWLPIILTMKGNADFEGKKMKAVHRLSRNNLLSKPTTGIPQEEILAAMVLLMKEEDRPRQAGMIGCPPTHRYRDFIMETKSPVGVKLLEEQLAGIKDDTELTGTVPSALGNYAKYPDPELFDEIVRINAIVSKNKHPRFLKGYFNGLKAIAFRLRNEERNEHYEKLIASIAESPSGVSNPEYTRQSKAFLAELKNKVME